MLMLPSLTDSQHACVDTNLYASDLPSAALYVLTVALQIFVSYYKPSEPRLDIISQ